MTDYSWVTNEMFDNKLEEMLRDTNAIDLLSMPGVYEILAEEWNNDILSALESEREQTD